MTTHFLRSYSQLVIQTCHRRGAFAMGGMAAQIPIKNDPAANEAALAKVRADKEREAGDGHDGTWVAHPGLVPVALEIFDRLMPAPNQLAAHARGRAGRRSRSARSARRARSPKRAFATTSTVGIQYLAAWLGGNGCVPINNLMEDAATAEISRAQIWQWVRHAGGVLERRPRVTRRALARRCMQRGTGAGSGTTRGAAAFAAGHYERAASCSTAITTAEPGFEPFLTLPAYRRHQIEPASTASHMRIER